MTIVTQQRVIASIWPWGASETLEEERQRQLKNSEREIKSLNKKLDEKEKK
jgi:Skp family chaperone for outer membrane proteins